jgi:hypothetical protein
MEATEEAGMFLTLMFLVACGVEIPITVETSACTDYDFDDPEAEGIEVSSLDGDWYVSHKGVFQGCADVFDPEISGQGRAITVREYWDARTEDDCLLCLAPTIVLEQPPAGTYEVGWYIGESNSPVDVVSFEVD